MFRFASEADPRTRRPQRGRGIHSVAFRLALALFIGWMSIGGANAQSTPAAPTASNPFDLIHRLPKIVMSGGSVAILPTNPFDVVPHRKPGLTASDFQKTTTGKSFLPKISLPKGKSRSKTFLFWSLVAAFGFLTFSIAANRSVVGKAWRGFLSNNHLAIAHRESSGLVGFTPYMLLYASFVLNAGIFIFLITRVFQGDRFDNLGFLLMCVVGAGVLFALKHSFLYFVAWLFPVRNEIKRYNFLITIFNCVLGLFLVPFNFLIAFVQNFGDFVAFWTLGLVAVFYLYRSLRAGAIGSKFLATDHFHFLLYLCTVEIAPVLLLFKIATLV